MELQACDLCGGLTEEWVTYNGQQTDVTLCPECDKLGVRPE